MTAMSILCSGLELKVSLLYMDEHGEGVMAKRCSDASERCSEDRSLCNDEEGRSALVLAVVLVRVVVSVADVCEGTGSRGANV